MTNEKECGHLTKKQYKLLNKISKSKDKSLIFHYPKRKTLKTLRELRDLGYVTEEKLITIKENEFITKEFVCKICGYSYFYDIVREICICPICSITGQTEKGE